MPVPRSPRQVAPAALLVHRIGVDPDPGVSIIGGKAASLYRMHGLGLPVPPAFVISTDACRQHLTGRRLPARLLNDMAEAMSWLQEVTRLTFGGSPPLLVSVRSGAPLSMPGMMDTVLNVGFTDAVENAIAKRFGPTHAAATRHRFNTSYCSVVLQTDVADIGVGGVPDDPWEQLHAAVEAVFASWNSVRAVAYRKRYRIAEDVGTAVTVQAMVLGNLNRRSGTGVVFSRDPLTGERRLFGEWLTGAQGEDLVSGEVDGRPLDELAELLPEVHSELAAHVAALERAGADLQDIEFTVEDGKLWLLQARAAKRSPLAAVRAAVDMAHEGLIDQTEALRRVSPEQVRLLCAPSIGVDTRKTAAVLAQGVAASPGVGIGVVVTSSAEAEDVAEAGGHPVLARRTTCPEDFPGMSLAVAVVTEHGGATCHAAVASRELGVPCVVGCGSDTVTHLAGRTVTVDGAAGFIFDGALSLEQRDEETDEHLAALLEWAQAAETLRVLRPTEVPADLPVLELHNASRSTPQPFAVRAAEFESPKAAAAAINRARQCGASAVVTERRLPLLLECLRRTSADGAPS